MEVVLKNDVKSNKQIHYQWNAIDSKNENGFICIDENWAITYLNKTIEIILGIQLKEALNKNFWIVFKDFIPLIVIDKYSSKSPKEIPQSFTHYLFKMGAWILVNTYYYDNLLSISVKLKKSDEKEQSPGKELIVMNELYKFVTEITNNCLWDWNIKTSEIFWIDGGHKRLFGYDMENCLLPQTFWENRIHPDDKTSLVSKLHKISGANNEQTLDYEYRFRKANNEYAYVHDHARIIRDDHNLACKIIGTTYDITDKKKAEIKLEAIENKLSMIVEQTINGIIITDSKDAVIYINKAFTHITGFNENDVIGKKPGKLLQGEETDMSTVQYIGEMIKKKLPFDCEILNYTKSKQKVWIHLQGQPYSEINGEQDKYFATQTDITESVLSRQKQLGQHMAVQNEIAEAVLTALEKERNHIAIEMHDNLNHTLVASKLYIEMALSEANNYVMYLRKSSGFIGQVIEEIRRISKGLIGDHLLGFFQSIHALIDDIMLVHPVKISFCSGNIQETGLEEKMKLNIFRIIQEQLTNIIKHSCAGKVKIMMQTRNDNILLTISDNGIGCDTTLKRNGVGITNINTRARIFNGNVRIISKPSRGFKLQVSLNMK